MYTKKHIDIKDSELEQAIRDFASEKQDTYKALYLRITQQRERTYKNVEIILAALSKFDKDVTQHDLLVEIQKKVSNISAWKFECISKKISNT